MIHCLLFFIKAINAFWWWQKSSSFYVQCNTTSRSIIFYFQSLDSPTGRFFMARLRILEYAQVILLSCCLNINLEQLFNILHNPLPTADITLHNIETTRFLPPIKIISRVTIVYSFELDCQ